MKPGAHPSFGALPPIEAGILLVGYAAAGPADGPAVLLLHGWPYDLSSAVDVARVRAAAGSQGIVPYLRGYGPTRCRSPATPRHGPPSVLAVDSLAVREARPIAPALLAE
jgi:pimeloyl-ACP methyl ester carboxylesterase